MDTYIIIKIVHYLAFVSWMAGLFYLPRLFVYHAENSDNADFVRVVKIQQRRLFWAISTPAMIVAVLTGLSMLMLNPILLSSGGYMHVKLLCAAILLGLHLYNFICLKNFANDKNTHSGKFYRFYNEIPTIIFIIIAIMMIARPI